MITPKFKPEKLVHALAFFSNTGVSDLTKLKAAKLLYFADKAHLLRYGRPILGDVYYCLPCGPVPSVALNEMNNAISAPEVEDEDRKLFRSVLTVKTGFFWHRYPVFESRGPFDPDVFSDSELEILKEVATKYGSLSARRLVDLTHDEPTWTIPNKMRAPESRAQIPYELFFAGAPAAAQQMLELLRAEREEAQELEVFLNQKTDQPLVHA